MTLIQPVILTGKYVQLEPLNIAHHDELVDAVRDGEMWNLWYANVPSPERMKADIERRLGLQAQGAALPFVTRRLSDSKVLGMTSYINIEAEIPRLEVGATWNSAAAHGSGTNADSKYLLLEHAFETLGCVAVELRTSWHNNQSREAIAWLGARQDGVLRNYSRLADGSLRDVVVFSILSHEWGAVRAGLAHRLAKQR